MKQLIILNIVVVFSVPWTPFPRTQCKIMKAKP
jgi:hypothetical protein